MAAPAAVLRILISANSAGAVGSLRATQGELGKTATSAQKTGQALRDGLKWGAIGAGAATLASAKFAMDFERNMRNVNSIAQLSEGDFADLNQKVLDMAGPTAQAPKVLADGLYDIVSSGFKAKAALKILRAGAVAATAGLTDTATATRAVTAVLNAYHRPAADAKAVSNDLFQTVNLGVLNFQELSSTIGDVLPFAAQLGVGLKGVGAATTTMTKAGINAPETMTRIKNVMVALFKPSEALKKAYEELGVAGGQELIKKMGGGVTGFQHSLEAIVNTTLKTKDLQKAYKDLGVKGFDELKRKMGGGAQANAALAEQLAASGSAVAQLFPNIRALGGALALTGSNTAGAEKDLKGFKDTTGATAKVFKEQSKSMAIQLEHLKTAAEVMAIRFGMTVLPALNKFAHEITHILSDKNLTGGEKFSKIGELIGKALGDAAPYIAKAAGMVALVAVRSFFSAWRSSPLWFKLLTAGFIIAKMGGFKGLTAAGAKAGAAYGTGMAAGIKSGAAAGAVGGAAGSGVKAGAVGGAAAGLAGTRKFGKDFRPGAPVSELGAKGVGPALKGGLTALGPMARTIGKTVIGLQLVMGIADAVTVQGLKGVGDRAQHALSGITLGIIPEPRTIAEKMQEAIKFATRGGDLKMPGFSRAIEDMQKGVDAKGAKLIQRLHDLRQRATKVFGPDTKLSLEVAVDPRRAEQALPRIQSEFERFTNGAVLNVKQLKKETARQFSDISFLMGSHSKEGRMALQKQFALSLGTIVNFKRRGTITAGEAGQQIAFLLKSRTAKGKEGLERNMLAAEGAIAATMSRGGKTTRKGMDLIQLLMVNTMKNMGLSPDSIRMSINTKESARKGKTFPEQRGGAISRGMVVQGGKPIGDSVHAVLERGEVVVNRRAVQKLGGPQRVDQVNRMFPRFQSGGIAGMVSAANKLDQAHFPYQWGGGHQATPAPYGAMDCSGAVSFVLQHGGVKIPTMTSGLLAGAGQAGPGPVTVFANSGHTFMRIGKRYFGTSGTNPGGGAGWMPDPGEAYRANFAERHFKAGKGFRTSIPRLQVKGPDGNMKTTVQGALDKVRGGANKKLQHLATQALGAGDAGDPGPFTGGGNAAENRRLGKRMAAAFGWRGAEWRALDKLWRGESGWINQMNQQGSGATGIPQALPGSKMASEGKDWQTNPATQIRWGLKYIRGTYGDPINAYNQWLARSPHWYQSGGIAGFQDGGIAGMSDAKAADAGSPIVAKMGKAVKVAREGFAKGGVVGGAAANKAEKIQAKIRNTKRKIGRWDHTRRDIVDGGITKKEKPRLIKVQRKLTTLNQRLHNLQQAAIDEGRRRADSVTFPGNEPKPSQVGGVVGRSGIAQALQKGGIAQQGSGMQSSIAKAADVPDAGGPTVAKARAKVKHWRKLTKSAKKAMDKANANLNVLEQSDAPRARVNAVRIKVHEKVELVNKRRRKLEFWRGVLRQANENRRKMMGTEIKPTKVAQEGFARGGVVGQKGGAAPVRNVRKLAAQVWGQTKALGGAGFEEKMPRLKLGGDSKRYAGLFHGSNKTVRIFGDTVQALTGPKDPKRIAKRHAALEAKRKSIVAGGITAEEKPGLVKVQDKLTKLVEAKGGGAARSAALETLVHEFAHAAQPLNTMKRWEIEGGAESFAQWASPTIYKNLGVPYTGAVPAYPNFVAKAAKEHTPDWVHHAQFIGKNVFTPQQQRRFNVGSGQWEVKGADGKWRPEHKHGQLASGTRKMAKGGAVGYIGDSLGVGTLQKLRPLLDSRIDSNVLTGRSSASGVGALKGMLKGKKKQTQFVFDLGTNDSNSGQVSSSLSAFNRLTGKGTPLHALTLMGPEAKRKNSVLSAAAGDDIDLVDWARVAGQYVKSDPQHIHPNDSGYLRRAQMVASAVKKSRASERLTKGQKKQLRKVGRGEALPKQFKTTMRALRQVTAHTKFGRLLRNKRVSSFIKKVKGYGVLPRHLETKIQFTTDNAALYGDNADKAGQLTTDATDADGNAIADAQGRQLVNWTKYQGFTQPEWLQTQLDRLYRLRNYLADAVGVIKKRRKELSSFIKRVRALIAQTKRQVKQMDEHRKSLEKRLKVLKQNPKTNRKKIDEANADLARTKRGITNKQHNLKDLTRMLGGDNKGLLGTQSQLGTALGSGTSLGEGYLSQLTDVQGPQGSMKQIKGMLPLTQVGGAIFDVQKALADLQVPREKINADTSSESQSKELLQQLLREANLRTAVSEAQFKTIKEFQAAGGVRQFGVQQFATGGIVQGATGAAQPAVVHGGEGVFTPRQMAAMGSGGGNFNVKLIFPPGMDWLKNKIKVEVEQQTRRQSRAGQRGLASRGGG